MMDFVSNLEEIIENILTLEKYLKSKDENEKEFAEDLVRRGKTILVYKVNGENHFAPSRFSGYKKNNMAAHIENEEKDGRDTNPVISSIVGHAFVHSEIDDKFVDYCAKLGLEVVNNKRRYWRLKKDGKYLNLEL